MTNKYTFRIHISNLKEYMSYQKFIWTHSFHASIIAGSRYVDAHQTGRLLAMLPLQDAEIRFSWLTDEELEEIARFFRSHSLLADTETARAGISGRPAYQH